MDPYVEFQPVTASTNDDARERILQGVAHGYTVYAGRQTAGRGRRGRVWHSPEGRDVFMSIAVTERPRAGAISQLPLAVGVAVSRWLAREFDVDSRLKWPNDVLVDDRKICGVLCEGVVHEGQVAGAVAGIGLNLGLRREDAPDELSEAITSVHMLTGSDPDVEEAVRGIRAEVLRSWEALRDMGLTPILEEWRRRDGTSGRSVRFTDDAGDHREGVAGGLAEDGALIVALGDGSRRTVATGEVVFTDSRTAAARGPR